MTPYRVDLHTVKKPGNKGRHHLLQKIEHERNKPISKSFRNESKTNQFQKVFRNEPRQTEKNTFMVHKSEFFDEKIMENNLYKHGYLSPMKILGLWGQGLEI